MNAHRTFARSAALAAVLGISLAAAAAAQELRGGFALDPSSLDPHYHNFSPNNAVAQHFFDGLTNFDRQNQPQPGLAESWRPLNDTTWEFRLRPGVRFHDGAPLTVEDIAFSIARAPAVPNSPSSFAMFVAGMTVEKVDDLTLRIVTAAPNPLVPNNLANVMIVRRAKAEGAGTPQFNSGEALVGTGPYRFVSFTPGAQLVMARNDDYWGGAQPYARVTVSFIRNATARTAALLSESVDFIDQPPTADIGRLRADARFTVTQGVTARTMYLHLDQFRDESPFVTGVTGRNPLRDARVRRAISMAINRQAIVDRVMEGVAEPAAQIMPPFAFGASRTLQPVPFDPEGARRLLAEAGYPDGFGITLHGPNDRYVNDARIAQAIAQMLSRIGIRTEVDTMPGNVFFTQATTGGPNRTPRYSLILLGFASGTGENGSALRSLLGTFDPARAMGAANRGRYSNPVVDDLVLEALRTVDDTRRAALLERATNIAFGEDVGAIALHHQHGVWAARKPYQVLPRSYEGTLVMDVIRAP
jgi:peptide/nickel transport system substrate-binding protein